VIDIGHFCRAATRKKGLGAIIPQALFSKIISVSYFYFYSTGRGFSIFDALLYFNRNSKSFFVRFLFAPTGRD
jgi:hypothetical protein